MVARSLGAIDPAPLGLARLRELSPRTRAYVARRTAEGKTTREIRRCLERYLARELYRTLTATMTPSQT
jgi:transposase